VADASSRPVAISGLGSIGSQHAAAFAGLGVPVVGFDPVAGSGERDAPRTGIDRLYGSFDELLAARPRAMVIATPDSFHLEQLDAATRAGVPTLVEKPLAASLDAAMRSVPGILARGVPVLVGYVLRHRSVTRTVRSLLREGVIGEATSFQVMLGAYGTITAARSRFAEPEPDRLYRDYSHEWDYLRWLFGPVRQVLAVARTVGSVAHVERPNVVDALLQTSAGITGAVHLDYAEPRGTRTLHILGTGGSLFADIARGTVRLFGAHPDDDREIALPQSPMEALQAQGRHLLQVADGTTVPAVNLDDGLAALAVTEAAVRAAASGQWEPVAEVGDAPGSGSGPDAT
jgi:predicted dehydrogenase